MRKFVRIEGMDPAAPNMRRWNLERTRSEPVARFHCLCASLVKSARSNEYGRNGLMTEGRTSAMQGGNSTISWSGKAYARLSLVREVSAHASFPQVGYPVLPPLRTD